MQDMRELFRSGLGRALRDWEPLDRITAAWPVAAGTALAAHGKPATLDAGNAHRHGGRPRLALTHAAPARHAGPRAQPHRGHPAARDTLQAPRPRPRQLDRASPIQTQREQRSTFLNNSADERSTPGAPAPTERVSLDDVRHVAALANLELTPEEEPRMQRDLNAILGHIEQLNELDTKGVEPMAQVSVVFADAEYFEVKEEPQTTEGSLHLRHDLVEPSLDRAAVLNGAPETDGRFFKVPKVIER